jgi:Circularly permutated YpsA SLOG family
MICKLISRGQTGVDRAALDAALRYGIECGGWCPAGRLDEFGRIPARYPLMELEGGGFDERTMQNVKDADGTLIICQGEPRGGTWFTLECCRQLHSPSQVIDASSVSAGHAARSIADFVRVHDIGTLNVAGPRESEWPEGHAYTVRVLDIFLGKKERKKRAKKEKVRRATRSGALLRGRGARRNKRGSGRPASKSKRH